MATAQDVSLLHHVFKCSFKLINDLLILTTFHVWFPGQLSEAPVCS